MNILVITSSPQQANASTYTLAQAMLKQLSNSHSISVEYIDTTTLPHIDNLYAEALHAHNSVHEINHGSTALSDQLITALELAELVIIASPMHNYSLPSSLKCWIDHVVRVGKTFEITPMGKQGLLNDKPVYVLISSGGWFLGESAMQPDYFTPYMKDILATIGLKSVHFFALQGTANSDDLIPQQLEQITQSLCEHLRKNVN